MQKIIRLYKLHILGINIINISTEKELDNVLFLVRFFNHHKPKPRNKLAEFYIFYNYFNNYSHIKMNNTEIKTLANYLYHYHNIL